MRVEGIKLENFKAFRSAKLVKLPSLCVVVGANGSGKSTLLDVFGFLHDCLMQDVTTALHSRGGFDEVLSRCASDKVIALELEYRLPVAGVERLLTYRLEIRQEGKGAVVEKELLQEKRQVLLDFSRGSGYALFDGEQQGQLGADMPGINKLDATGAVRMEAKLDKPDMLATKVLGQLQQCKAVNAFCRLMEGWHISDFHINLARGSKDAAGYSEHLSASGDNLQLVARRLCESEPDAFAGIMEQMQRWIPGIVDVAPEAAPDGRLLLKFKDGSFADPFIDRHVSDGTITMFAYLALLHDPAPHPLLCVEEPEKQLHPALLGELAEEFRAYTTRGCSGQVFVSTHSPDFLNAIQVDEVLWLEKQDGYAKATRANENEQVVAYMKEGDQMGYLWTEGFFPGAKP